MSEISKVSEYSFNRNKISFLRSWWLDIDKTSFLIITSLICFGVIASASASSIIATRLGLEKTFFLQKHIIFALISILIIFCASFLREKEVKIIAIIGIFLFIALLVSTILFSQSNKGSKRWIYFFGFTLQPSEFIKPLFILVNAIIFDKFHQAKFYVKYGSSAILYLIIISLLLLQPDFGMAVVFSLIWGMSLFIYGIPNVAILAILIVGICGIYFVYHQMPHVANRVHKFFNIDQNYQLDRSLDAYMNGGLSGKGPAQGEVKNLIPDAHTDFIMPVISEEFGALFCIFILIGFFILFNRMLKKANQEENIFNHLAISGLITIIILQMTINTGVTVGLLPTKGMTFPFVSYGGSSLVSNAFTFGILLSLTKERYLYK
jgi:cell division protein FtsW